MCASMRLRVAPTSLHASMRLRVAQPSCVRAGVCGVAQPSLHASVCAFEIGCSQTSDVPKLKHSRRWAFEIGCSQTQAFEALVFPKLKHSRRWAFEIGFSKLKHSRRLCSERIWTVGIRNRMFLNSNIRGACVSQTQTFEALVFRGACVRVFAFHIPHQPDQIPNSFISQGRIPNQPNTHMHI